jgi:hypothetical protein
LRINYTVIEDPKLLSVAREFIRAQLPLPASLNRDTRQAIDWLKANIVVLKIVVELLNEDENQYTM